jgi:hypothetical protein
LLPSIIIWWCGAFSCLSRSGVTVSMAMTFFYLVVASDLVLVSEIPSFL